MDSVAIAAAKAHVGEVSRAAMVVWSKLVEVERDPSLDPSTIGLAQAVERLARAAEDAAEIVAAAYEVPRG